MRNPTLDEVIEALQTLTRISSSKTSTFPGAVGTDVDTAREQLIETKRQLTAYARWRFEDLIAAADQAVYDE